MINERSPLLPALESAANASKKSQQQRDRTRRLGLLAIFGELQRLGL